MKDYGWINTKQAAQILGMTQRGVQRYTAGKYKAFRTKWHPGPKGREMLLVHIDDVLKLKTVREKGEYINAKKS